MAIRGASIYMTDSPCNICTKIIINAGIKKIIYSRRYIDDMSTELLKESKIEVKKFMVNPTIEDFHEEEESIDK